MPPLRFLRLANPIVRVVLESPLHRLLSGQLVVLTYRGHLSGRLFRIPLRYAEAPDGVVALAVRPERKLWWRSFRGATYVTLTLRGRHVEGRGVLVSGSAHDAARAAYAARFPRARRVAESAAIVVFTASDSG